MSRRKTHEEYVEQLKTIAPDIEVLDTYKTNKTHLRHRHKTCGHVWQARPDQIIKGTRCPNCSHNKVPSQEEYLAKLKIKNPNIVPVEKYVDSHTKILHKHKVCGHTWKVSPSSLYTGNGCPICSQRKKITDEEYKTELKALDRGLINLEPYKGRHIKILHRHSCGYEWKVKPNDIIQRNVTCPKCATSTLETSIVKALDLHNILYEYQVKVHSKSRKTIDFYFPERNIYIEANGIQHYKRHYFHEKQEEKVAHLEDALLAQLVRDQLISKLKQSKGPSFYQIPYTVSLEELEQNLVQDGKINLNFLEKCQSIHTKLVVSAIKKNEYGSILSLSLEGLIKLARKLNVVI